MKETFDIKNLEKSRVLNISPTKTTVFGPYERCNRLKATEITNWQEKNTQEGCRLK